MRWLLLVYFVYGYHGASRTSFSKLFKQKRVGELCNK